jgi:lipopolysaccharide biosynthesis glycosyltransferase
MNKRAVVTLAIGKWEDMPTVHVPMKRYAKYCDADFIKITKRLQPNLHIYYEKAQMLELFDRGYDQILYLDSDLFVTPNAFKVPPIFDQTEDLAMFDERTHGDFWTYTLIRGHYWKLGVDMPDDWDGHYYNAGVMLIPKKNKYMLKNLIPTDWSPFDQTSFNIWITMNKAPVHRLSYRFNCMPYISWGVRVEDAFFVHYAGWKEFDRCHTMGHLMDYVRKWPEPPPANDTKRMQTEMARNTQGKGGWAIPLGRGSR